MTCSLTSCSFLNAMNCTPEITNDHFSDGRIGEPYAARFEATCGEWDQAFRVQSGSLPPGLELAMVNGRAGISGTPTVAGTYGFTLEMVVRPGIARQFVTKDLSIRILP